jgi:uncharacterized protein YjbJ (UPF0337 family)
MGDGCPKGINSSHRRRLRCREYAPELTQPAGVSIVSQPVRLCFGELCCVRREVAAKYRNIPAGDARIKSHERRKSIRQSTKDKSKSKFHEVKGKRKEKVGQAANKAHLEVIRQGKRIGGRIPKNIGEGEEILAGESAWVRFCDIMGGAIPPSLRSTKTSRARRR